MEALELSPGHGWVQFGVGSHTEQESGPPKCCMEGQNTRNISRISVTGVQNVSCLYQPLLPLFPIFISFSTHQQSTEQPDRKSYSYEDRQRDVKGRRNINTHQKISTQPPPEYIFNPLARVRQLHTIQNMPCFCSPPIQDPHPQEKRPSPFPCYKPYLLRPLTQYLISFHTLLIHCFPWLILQYTEHQLPQL